MIEPNELRFGIRCWRTTGNSSIALFDLLEISPGQQPSDVTSSVFNASFETAVDITYDKQSRLTNPLPHGGADYTSNTGSV